MQSMSAKIIRFPGITKWDLNPDDVLRESEGQLQSVVVVGFTKDGAEFFASSIADGADTLWHLQRAIHKLMQIAEDQ
jgi:hypothetical protein